MSVIYKFQGLSKQWRSAAATAWRQLPSHSRVALLGTGVLTAFVLVLPAQEESPGDTRPRATSESAFVERARSVSTGDEAGQLWRRFFMGPRPEFSEAEHDPFAGHSSAPVPPEVAAASPIVVTPFMGPPPPPPAPPPPATQFRVLGWLRVDGQSPQLFLSNGHQELAASVGTSLPDGFVVQEFNARGVLLRHPQTQTAYLLPLPDSLPFSSASTLKGP